jgi:Beta-1,3-glucanase
MQATRSITATLIALAFAAGVLWDAGAVRAQGVEKQNNLGLRTVPFRIVNHTNHPGKLYVYINGLVPTRGNRSFYVSNRSGNLTIVPQSATPQSLALDLGRNEVVNLQLPQLTAMRIYFSLGRPVLVTATAQGAPPSTPAGWVKTDPNYRTIFDWTEFTWVDDPPAARSDSTIGGNATQVDMFGIPMLIALRGHDDDGNPVTRKSGFSDAGARQKIFTDLANAGRPWSRLVLGANNVMPLRVIAPYHGMDFGVFPQNQLQGYINQVFQRYGSDSNRLTGQTQNRTYRGRVVGGDLVFTELNGSETFKFKKPNSKQAYQNDLPPIPNPLTPAGDRARAIGALLGGAFMRTALLLNSNLNACRKAQFYRDRPVNVYGRVFHTYGLRRLAYAFGFDDTCDQSSFVQVHDPAALTITLQGL